MFNVSARKFISVLLVLASINMFAQTPADSIQKRKPRFSVRKTGAEDQDNLKTKTADLKEPDNLKTDVIYDEKDNTYTVGTTLDKLSSSKGTATTNNASTSRTTSPTMTLGQAKHINNLNRAVVCIGFDDYNLDCLQGVQYLYNQDKSKVH